jgi:hypothetical protein
VGKIQRASKHERDLISQSWRGCIESMIKNVDVF